jgi:sirohydrochlorin ferrochelatase
LAEALRRRAVYPIVEIAYLELSEPTIPAGARACVAQGATGVFMLPYFLSAGTHVTDDLERFRRELTGQFPAVQFALCEPLSNHPLLLDIVLDRLADADCAKSG